MSCSPALDRQTLEWKVYDSNPIAAILFPSVRYIFQLTTLVNEPGSSESFIHAHDWNIVNWDIKPHANHPIYAISFNVKWLIKFEPCHNAQLHPFWWTKCYSTSILSILFHVNKGHAQSTCTCIFN